MKASKFTEAQIAFVLKQAEDGTPAGAAIAVAMILQRSEYSSEARPVAGPAQGDGAQRVTGSPVIVSAGGYLRALTEKARAGAFSLGPMLMAIIGQRQKARRGRAPVQ